jgi:hypothetical protein
MADVVLNLIDPLEARYRWDKTPEQIAIAKRDMVEAFRNHAIEDLKAALIRIVTHRKFSTMPTVGDITDVVNRVVAERKLAENKPKATGVPASTDEFLERLHLENDDAKAWARDWLQWSPLGRESLRDGWCRELHNMVWQIRRNRLRAGKACEFEDIKLDDIATQTTRGKDLIDYMRAHNRALNPEFERKVVLREKLA